MSDIYCGAKDVPNKKRRGSMKECAEKRKVMYYGLKKIDSRLYKNIMENKNKKNSLAELQKKIV